MIKGIILDVDGVLVGGKKGFNWPEPNPEVMNALTNLRKQGVVVSLCTGKGTFAIDAMVRRAHLDNLHIGDGGAVVVDPINKEILQQHSIPHPLVQKLVDAFLRSNIYVELYTPDGYYVQKNLLSDKTEKHTKILYKEPTIVESLNESAHHLSIVKIMPIADNEIGKQKVTQLFSEFEKELTLQWGIHPTALPYQFGIITQKGISKKQAAQTIAQHTGISLDTVLGIGDGMTDWQFMEICGYAGAMGNGVDELKKMVGTKGERGYVGKSVDENGVLDILSHFQLM